MRKINVSESMEFDSSAIEKAWYSLQEQTLYVQFPSGNRAGYARVPSHVWRQLIDAESAGRYYAYQIKGRYNGIAVDRHDEFVLPVPAKSVAVSSAPGVKTFKVRANVTAEVTMEIAADSLEAAMAGFSDALKKANLDSAKVEFVEVAQA